MAALAQYVRQSPIGAQFLSDQTGLEAALNCQAHQKVHQEVPRPCCTLEAEVPALKDLRERSPPFNYGPQSLERLTNL